VEGMRLLALLLILVPTACRKPAAPAEPLAQGACPGQQETLNGWKDDDGCPDELARLQVTITRQGEPVQGVRVTLPGAEPRYTNAQGQVVFLELLPVPRGGLLLNVDDPFDDVINDYDLILREGENRVEIGLKVPE